MYPTRFKLAGQPNVSTGTSAAGQQYNSQYEKLLRQNISDIHNIFEKKTENIKTENTQFLDEKIKELKNETDQFLDNKLKEFKNETNHFFENKIQEIENVKNNFVNEILLNIKEQFVTNIKNEVKNQIVDLKQTHNEDNGKNNIQSSNNIQLSNNLINHQNKTDLHLSNNTPDNKFIITSEMLSIYGTKNIELNNQAINGENNQTKKNKKK
jgi:hypothetical protein